MTKGIGGFNVKVACEHCNQSMSPANLVKHIPACLELLKYQHLFVTKITTREFKQFRMRLRTEYEMTVEDFAQYHDSQMGNCFICDEPSTGTMKHLCVDHCHDTGNIRGLLCSRCNLFVGLARNDVGLLSKAGRYLQREDWHS